MSCAYGQPALESAVPGGQSVVQDAATQPSTSDQTLWEAVRRGDNERLDALLDPSQPLEFNVACALGLEHEVRRMLAEDPTLVSKPRDGRYPIQRAAGRGHDRIAALLLQAEEAPESGTEAYALRRLAPLVAGASGGHVEVARLLLNAGVKLEDLKESSHIRMWSPLASSVAASGSVETMRLLLERGLNVEDVDIEKHSPPLVLAAAYAHLPMVELLFPLQTSGDARDQALYSAAQNGHRPVVRFLLSKGVGITPQRAAGSTALHAAAANGCVDIVRDLCHAGADPLAKNKDGRTPIDRARISRRHLALRVLEGFAGGRLNAPADTEP